MKTVAGTYDPKSVNIQRLYTPQQVANKWDAGVSNVYVLIQKRIVKSVLIDGRHMIPEDQLSKGSKLFPTRDTYYGRKD